MKVGTIGLVPYAKPGSNELFGYFEKAAPFSDAFILAHHGPVVGGTSLMETFFGLEVTGRKLQDCVDIPAHIIILTSKKYQEGGLPMQQTLELLQKQKQILTQKQIQSLTILAMDNVELDCFLRQEYLDNPMLEINGQSPETVYESLPVLPSEDDKNGIIRWKKVRI